MPEDHEQIVVRRKKLQALRERGIDPYPNDFRPDHTTAEVHARLSALGEAELARAGTLSIAGRVMAVRDFGKAGFLQVQDRAGRLQVHARRDRLGDEGFQVYRLLDLGDVIGVAGRPFRTRTGELTLEATALRLLAKAFRPLPEKWHGLQDVETRYRQRYLDLIVNPDARRIFEVRARAVRYLRDFLVARGYLEVETPMMQPIAGGAAARPFVTHHNALDVDLYLRIAPEPHLVQPIFVTQFPIELSPLARRSDRDPRFVDRFELFVARHEIANAFSELNDPEDQRGRFEEQLRARAAGDAEAHAMDADYVRALEHGMPPTAGEGIGIDRLVMLLTGATSIREVILFPHLRPEGAP